MWKRFSVLAIAAAMAVTVATAGPAVADPTPPPGPVTARLIEKYGLTPHQVVQIGKARKWAAGDPARQGRRCLSGNDYRLDQGDGRFGAYQLTARTWRSFGGRQFAEDAAAAPRFAQNLVAWKNWRKNGDSTLDCPTDRWIGSVYGSAGGTKIAEMLLPGTHDAASSLISDTAPCTTRLIVGAPSEYEVASKINPCGTAAMAKAQGQNLGAQLRGGVRYLDLRVGVPKDKVITAPRPPAENAADVPLVFHHEFVSQRVTKGLKKIVKFVAAHPREQVILDFQHVTLTGDPAIDAYYIDALDRLMRRYAPAGAESACATSWSSKAIGVADRNIGTKVPVSRAWRKGRNLIVLFKPDVMPDRSCYRDRSQALISLWPNTQDPATSTSANHGYLETRQDKIAGQRSACIDADGNWCGLFVSQLQLSFQRDSQIACVLEGGPECSLFALSQLVNDDVAAEIRRWRIKQGLPANIAMVDFYESSTPSIVDELIRLNWRLAD